MGLAGQGAPRTRRSIAHRGAIVSAIRRTRRNFVVSIQLDEGCQVIRIGDAVAGRFALFQGELLGCSVNLPQVVDASSGLRGGAGFYEAGNRDCRQEADNGHDNHNFHQREGCLEEDLRGFHTLLFSVSIAA